jgi:hypothetical protein
VTIPPRAASECLRGAVGPDREDRVPGPRTGPRLAGRLLGAHDRVLDLLEAGAAGGRVPGPRRIWGGRHRPRVGRRSRGRAAAVIPTSTPRPHAALRDRCPPMRRGMVAWAKVEQINRYLHSIARLRGDGGEHAVLRSGAARRGAVRGPGHRAPMGTPTAAGWANAAPLQGSRAGRRRHPRDHLLAGRGERARLGGSCCPVGRPTTGAGAPRQVRVPTGMGCRKGRRRPRRSAPQQLRWWARQRDKDLADQRTGWQQRMHATLYHLGAPA